MADPAQMQNLFVARGGLAYGEGVSQWEHAVQCADLAEREGASASLIVAALLHDIGHLLEDEAEVVGAATDLRHEILGARSLRRLFGPDVRGPIALHVAAKRYLCFKEDGYQRALSPASIASLELQGGAFDADAAAAFERLPYWREAVTLRRFDDQGKRIEPTSRGFGDYTLLIDSVLIGDRR